MVIRQDKVIEMYRSMGNKYRRMFVRTRDIMKGENRSYWVNLLLLLTMISFILPLFAVSSYLLIILGIIGFCCGSIKRMQLIKRNDLALGFLAYFLVLGVSIWYSNDFWEGIAKWLKVSPFFFIPVIFSGLANVKIHIFWIGRGYIRFVIGLFAVLIMVAIARNFMEGYTPFYILERLADANVRPGKYPFLNYWYFSYEQLLQLIQIQPIYMGLFINVAIVFLLSLSYNRWFVLKCLPPLLVFLALTGSRWQFLVGLACITFHFLFFMKNLPYMQRVLILALVGVFSLGAIGLNPVAKERVLESLDFNKELINSEFGGTSLRLKKWSSAWTLVKRQPVFGYGAGDARTELLRQYIRDDFLTGYLNKFHAHNQYLETALQFGAVGVFLLLNVFVIAFRKEIPLLSMLATLYALSFLTESILTRQWGLFSFPYYLLLASLGGGKASNATTDW